MSTTTFIGSCWDYVSQQLPAVPRSAWTDGKVLDCIDSLYPGGLSAFRAAHSATTPEPSCDDSSGRFMSERSMTHSGPSLAAAANLDPVPAMPSIVSIPTSPLTLRAMAEGLVGRRLVHTVFDEVTNLFEDEAGNLVVEVKLHEVRELSRADRVTATGLVRMTFPRRSSTQFGLWRRTEPRIEEVWVDDYQEYASSYSAPMTEERFLDKAEQTQLCYRPGSSRTPMDGYQVRESTDDRLIDLWNRQVISKWTPFS